MSTTTQASPEVKLVITEADAIAFLVAKNKQIAIDLSPLCAIAGLSEASFAIFPRHEGTMIHVSAYDVDYNSVAGNGDTFDAAVAAFHQKVKERTPTPEKLRAEAEALIARAHKLEEKAVAISPAKKEASK